MVKVNFYRLISALLVPVGLTFLPSNSLYAAPIPVDLRPWTAESYPAVAGFGAGNWVVSPDGYSVRQTVNGQPTLFYSDFNVMGSRVTGVIRVDPNWDDDYFGIALGFQPGDTTNPNADYILIDWKRFNQYYDFGFPSTTPGTTAYAGLAVSRVYGIPTADEFWGHTDFTSHPGGGLVELARGMTLGNVGWQYLRDYYFDFIYLPNRLQLYVDGVLQIDITGNFPDGRLAFYNFSQANVVYSAFTIEQIEMPAPGSLTVAILMILLSCGIYMVTRSVTLYSCVNV
jgi:hypothetical protein